MVKRCQRSLIAWCVFDWGNSAFPTLIITFIFSAYFTSEIAANPLVGTAQWGYAISFSAILVAIISPIIGAIADQSGQRKPWLFFFTIVCIIASGSLWFAEPSTKFVLCSLVAIAAANIGFEMGMVFYNAMLPSLTIPSTIGKWSGVGWGLGYAGGLSCLAIAMTFLVQTESAFFDFNINTFEHLRATGPLVSIWMAIFCVPLFFFTEDEPSRGRALSSAFHKGLKTFSQTITLWKNRKNVFCFLLARMLYIDGLNTLFAFGGIFAAGTMGFTFKELILLGISINIAAGFGAIVFGFIENNIGPKKLIVYCLFCLVFFGAGVLIVEEKASFWILIFILSIFVGPVQSASRSFMAHISPANARTEMFGLFAFSGKATAFLGPAILGWVTILFSSQRVGMTTILVFFCIGLFVLLLVREPEIETNFQNGVKTSWKDDDEVS